VGVVHFEIADPAFADIKPTTWRDLKDDYLVEDNSTNTSYRYALTGLGWRTGFGIELGSVDTGQAIEAVCRS